MNSLLSPRLPPPPKSAPRQPKADLPFRRRRSTKWAAALLLAMVLGYLIFRHFAGVQTPAKSASAANRVAPVVAEAARKSDVALHLTALGTVTPLATVTIRSRVDGQLVAVNFREGQMIEQNAPLAEIDPKPFEVQKAQAEAQLARDAALVDNARVDLQRFRTLWSQDSVAKEQVDTQEALVRQDEAQVKLDQALVDNASLQVGYTKITAPVSGRVGLRLVDVGNMVHAADPGGLTVIAQLQPISVLFSIPQDVLPSVLQRFQAGEAQPVTVYARDGATPLGTGKVVTIDNEIDPTTGSVKVRAEFPNTDQALFPNQFVNVELLLQEVKAAVVVPDAAVQHGAKGTFAYVVGADNKVEVRPLSVGSTEHNQVVVTKGLTEGERVVTDGVDKLRAGMTVDLVDHNAPPTGPANDNHGRNARHASNPPAKSPDPATKEAPAPNKNRSTAGKDRAPSS